MRLSKKAQYAALFVLYIEQHGRATVHDAASKLGLSQTFLEQVARLLRIANLIVVKRGPGGGYEMVGSPSLLDCLNAVKAGPLLTTEEKEQYRTGCDVKRRFADIIELVEDGMTRSLSVELGYLSTIVDETRVDFNQTQELPINGQTPIA